MKVTKETSYVKMASVILTAEYKPHGPEYKPHGPEYKPHRVKWHQHNCDVMKILSSWKE